MQIVDPVTGEVCPVDVEGELVLKGPQIMKGYLNNVAATKECMHDGWFASGKSFKMSSGRTLHRVLTFVALFIPSWCLMSLKVQQLNYTPKRSYRDGLRSVNRLHFDGLCFVGHRYWSGIDVMFF